MGGPSSLCPSLITSGVVRLRSGVFAVAGASPAPTAYLGLNKYCVILKLFACASLSYQTGSLTGQKTIDVCTIMLDLHGYSKSVCWIIFDNTCKKAVSKPMKGNEIEKLDARS